VLLFYQLPQWSEKQAESMEALTRSTSRLSWVVVLARSWGWAYDGVGFALKRLNVLLDSSRPEKAPISENRVKRKFSFGEGTLCPASDVRHALLLLPADSSLLEG
jgi:hypothetical protein